MRASNILHQRAFTNNFNEGLAFVSFLVQIPDIAGFEGFVEWYINGMMDTLEPDGDVGDERDFLAELGGDFAFVDVVGEGVGDYVVGEVFDIVFRRGFRAGS